MKFHQSLDFVQSKSSLLPASLQNAYIEPPTIALFTLSRRRLFAISLPLQSQTVEELIAQSIKTFKIEHQLSLPLGDYQLVAARKSGKRCDLPALDPSINILHTGVSCYQLICKSKEAAEIHAPVSQMANTRRKQRKPKENQNKTCFCLF